MHGTHDIELTQASVACSRTIYVGISNVTAGPQFSVAQSTNAKDFRAFLDKVLAARTDPEPRRPIWVILDGHPAHFTEREGVRDRLTDEDVAVMYLPRGASWFNR